MEDTAQVDGADQDTPSIIRDTSRRGTDTVAGWRLDWAAASDVGRLRETNEDAALVAPGSYLVADGMGGHESGEIASETALLTLGEVASGGDQTDTQATFIETMTLAQDRIGDIGPDSARRAGTTATGAVLVTHDDRPHWLVINIGDSRTYRYSGGDLEQVTIDHSQVQEFIDAGYITAEQARTDPRRNVITRALGAGMIEPEADYFSFPVIDGDILLMCTDGLTGELPDGEIADIFSSAPTPEAAVATLVDGALAVGGHDNVTVLVVEVHAVGEPAGEVPDAEVPGAEVSDAGVSDAGVPAETADSGATPAP